MSRRDALLSLLTDRPSKGSMIRALGSAPGHTDLVAPLSKTGHGIGKGCPFCILSYTKYIDMARIFERSRPMIHTTTPTVRMLPDDARNG